MRNRIGLCLGLSFAIVVLAAPTARAFTMQSNDGSNPNALPKFDIEEQSKNFRTGQQGEAAGQDNKKLFETPLGTGSLYFGVQQAPADVFSPGFGSTFGQGFNTRNHREDFNRVVTPENLR